MTMKRNNKKNIHILAVAAMTAALMTSQIPATMVFGAESSVSVSSLIPDNVTVEQPVPLSDIALPSSDYGTLSWVDGSCVPSSRVQSYDVVFRPYNTADLAGISGWDGQSDVIYSSVTVVVSSISSEEKSENSEDYQNGDNSEQDNQQDSGYSEESSEDNYGNKDQDPEVTETPEKEAEITENPEATDTPEVTEAPDATETPEITESPDVTETPEITETPDATEIPEVTEIPDATETPEVTEVPEVTATPETTPAADKDNIFDGKQKKISKDTRPQKVEDNLTEEEKEEMASENHSCNGISVSGINLPWYVQFRVASGENYEFTNEEAANLFKSYEFELWDTKNNTEYEIPDGEYLSVTVPVKAGYDYTIEHLLDSGAMETIVPSVEGSTMVFSTHSFSPFGIAGSKALIGENIEDKNYGTGGSTDSSATSVTATPAADASGTSTGSETQVTDQQEAADSSGNSASDTENDSEEANNSSSTKAVSTGDNTPIIPFVLLGIAAIAIIGVIIYLRKR